MNAPALSTEGHVLARNRTWASTFAGSCARPSHPEDIDRNRTVAEPPTRESNPALRLRRPPCVRHTRGESERVPSPGVEPGLRPSGGRVPSVTRRGHERSRRPGSNRHEPAYKAGASPFGHVGGEQGRKDLNPVREFWRLAALPGAHPCKWPRPVRCRGVVVDSGRGAGPARAAGTGTSSRPGRRARRRAASTRGEPAGCRRLHAGLLRESGPPCGRCSDSQAATQLVQLDAPPCERGTTWSIVIASPAGLRPAVLAGVMVALGHVSPAERHRRPGQAVVVRQADDLGGPEARGVPTGCTGGRPRARAPTTRPSRRAGTRPARRPSPSRSRA